MISYAEALDRLLSVARPLGCEIVPIDQASGRRVAEDIKAIIDAPRFDVAMMDGYAVRIADVVDGQWLEIIGEVSPGRPFRHALGPGQAVRIFTGARVPDKGDCVIMQEEALREGNHVKVKPGFGPSRYVRKKGSDFCAGDLLLAAGTRLTPSAMVALAGADVAELRVAKPVRYSLIATGDELVEPGHAHSTAQSIPDSASYGVEALARIRGGELAGRWRSEDSLDQLEHLAGVALDQSDLVVVLGGASVGERDFAKTMFEKHGLALSFSKVAIRPGKPVWFGMVGEKYVLGLPGNPGSAMVTARVFLAPLLAALQAGDAAGEVMTSPLKLASELPASGARETFTRARLGPEGLVPASNQDSGAQAPLGASDWLIRRSPDDHAREAGDMVEALPF